MNFWKRLGLCSLGAVLAAAIVTCYVVVQNQLSANAINGVGAFVTFVVMYGAYLFLALVAALLGSLLWLVVGIPLRRFETLLLPGTIALINFSLVSDAVRSTDFFADGGRWVPAIVLFLTVATLFFSQSGKIQNVR